MEWQIVARLLRPRQRHCALLPLLLTGGLLLCAPFEGGAAVWRLDRPEAIEVLAGSGVHDGLEAEITVYPDGGVWIAEAPDSTVKEEGGALFFESEGNDAITTPGNFKLYGPEIDVIEIEMAAWGVEEVLFSWMPGTASWGWSDEDGYCRIALPVKESGKFFDYRLSTADLPNWGGREIQGLRLRLPEGGRLALKSLHMQSGGALFAGSSWGFCEYRAQRALRPSLYTWAPMTLAFDLPDPDEGAARLVFSTSLLFARQGRMPRARIRILLEGQENTPLFDESFEQLDAWRAIERPIPAYKPGARLLLESSEAAAETIVLWANPLLYSRSEAASTQPNILVYVVDSLRADHLPCYGYERDTAPHLRAFADEGLLFEHFRSAETCTKASMTTLMSGVDALAHGIGCTGPGQPAGLPLFPALLREAGYVTGAVTENLYTPPDGPVAVEFSELVDLEEYSAARDGSTLEAVEDFLQKHRRRPFFLYVHTMEPHVRFFESIPVYDAPAPFLGNWGTPDDSTNRLTDLRTWEGASRRFHEDRYDECISFADANFQRVLDRLDALDLAENTVVLFLADHGEGFGAHGGRIIHGYEPFEELVGVPLILRWPGRIDPGLRMRGCYGMIDLAPTLLEIAGLGAPEIYAGASLVPCFKGRDIGADWGRLSYQGTRPGLLTHAAYAQGPWKVLGFLLNPLPALYHVGADPDEQNDLRLRHILRAYRMRAKLFRAALDQLQRRPKEQAAEAEERPVIDPERLERLRNLGYLE